MRLVLFDVRIVDEPHVLMHIEIEQWPGLPSRFRHDKVVERIVLRDKISM